MDEDYEHILLIKPDVFIYKIPARSNFMRSHRASDWKLDQPDWKGRLRLVVKGEKCILKLEEKTSCQLFAECFIEKFPGNDVETVSDSSRYFVIKIKNPNDNRTAFIGIGFEDRSDSFDLNVALQDHFKRVKEEKEGFDKKESDDDQPKIDLSLKEGQTIKVNLNLAKKTNVKPKTKNLANNICLLPPPPNKTTPNSKQSNSDLNFLENDSFNDLLVSTDKESASNQSKNEDNIEFDNSKVNRDNDEDNWGSFKSFNTNSNQNSTSNWATFS